jgi:hypothetical protein
MQCLFALNHRYPDQISLLKPGRLKTKPKGHAHQILRGQQSYVALDFIARHAERFRGPIGLERIDCKSPAT